VPNLASADWLILLIYAFFAMTAGTSLKQSVKQSRDYLQAGRAMPGWLCGLAIVGAGLGSPMVLGMGAAGARYGVASLGWFALGSIPALIFAGLFLMPVYSGAKTGAQDATVRSIPEYLGLRFDRKTRGLSACLFLFAAAFGAGISMYAMARVLVALRIFDQIGSALSLPPIGILLLTMTLPAALVLAYVLLGGLAAAMYNQAMQLCLTIAGLLPVVLLGLKRVGGWNGLKAAAPADFLHEWSGAAYAIGHFPGLGAVGWVLSIGVVVGGGLWCSDFRLLQPAMAAKDVETARRAPLIAATAMVFVPLVAVLPGLIAIASPTPHTTIVVRNENGAIYHDITVVPPAVDAGRGLVPARVDAATGKPLKGADGRIALDYTMATPNALAECLPMGLLGLGLSALLACLMSGVSASVTAFGTVFTCDIFQAFVSRGANDMRLLAVGRWAMVGGTLLSIGAACATMQFNSMLDAIVPVFAVVNAPLFAVLLAGVFSKRATGCGAFAGLLAGAAAALLHHGLALPRGEHPGVHGGWIAVWHHPSSGMALGLGTAGLAFCVSLVAIAAVSAFTKARPEAELACLVHPLTKREPENKPWWRRPETLGAGILLAAIVVNLLFI